MHPQIPADPPPFCNLVSKIRRYLRINDKGVKKDSCVFMPSVIEIKINKIINIKTFAIINKYIIAIINKKLVVIKDINRGCKKRC
ncbi:hypothetical protein BpHYR1_006560 [Brachionus plicatilis]|uniref:Uncharacterized protein n=1 Tax=Brachionus plicatilis TaxID=10195 RepID=A0A3M7SZB8_BRAPC|nr:hypothetical protein BpHYR1_006560 [Brachionus plicatilis]